MTMELLNVFGIALVTVLVALVLKQHHKELGVLAAVAGGGFCRWVRGTIWHLIKVYGDLFSNPICRRYL